MLRCHWVRPEPTFALRVIDWWSASDSRWSSAQLPLPESEDHLRGKHIRLGGFLVFLGLAQPLSWGLPQAICATKAQAVFSRKAQSPQMAYSTVGIGPSPALPPVTSISLLDRTGNLHSEGSQPSLHCLLDRTGNLRSEGSQPSLHCLRAAAVLQAICAAKAKPFPRVWLPRCSSPKKLHLRRPWGLPHALVHLPACHSFALRLGLVLVLQPTPSLLLLPKRP